ncbi:MAG: hypothetical protein WC709_12125, partial [Thermoleophilia bacterium]
MLLMFLPAAAGVLASHGGESQAAGLPGPQAAHGSDFTLLIKPGGSLWAWGANASGQLGDGSTTASTVAAPVGSATDWAAVACGDAFSLGVRSDGSLWAWGLNASGQLGLGDAGNRTTPQRVGSATDWVGVAGGDRHALALKSDGSLWAWGDNAYGQLGQGDTTPLSSPTQVGSATDWDSIACGASFSAAIKADRTLWVWGRNNRSQLGQGDTAVRLIPTQVGTDTDWASVGCGDEDVRALKSGGTLWAWGYNSFGQLGQGDLVTRSAPIQVGTDTDWAAFACGDDHTAALKSGGSLWAWGDNTYGQLGQGDSTALSTPTQVGSATDWSTILCGDDFTSARKPGDQLWGWGDNTSGDLGLGDVTNRLAPTLLFILTDSSPPGIASLTSSTHPVPATWYSVAAPAFSWSSSDASGIAGYKWVLDPFVGTVASPGYPNTATSKSYAAQADGIFYFHLRAVDRAGNWGPTSTLQVRIDTVAPSITVVRPLDSATYSQASTVTCQWTCSDPNAGVAGSSAALDGSPIAAGAAVDTLVTGTHTLAVTAADGAGNEATRSVTYAVDPLTFTITPSAGAGGDISPAAPQTVAFGADQAFTVTPAVGYHVADVLVDGGSVGAVTSYTFTNVTGDHTISATFTASTATITPSAGAHGSISPASAQTVDYGADQAFTITPATGYHVADVLVDGGSVGAATSYTFTNVTADHTISATFAIDTFTITTSAGAHGSISPNTPQTVNYGASKAFTIAPDIGYHVADVLVDSVSVGAVTAYTFSGVTADHTISVSFAADTFTITPSAGAHGSISPATAQTVSYGGSRSFTITPSTGYHIA